VQEGRHDVRELLDALKRGFRRKRKQAPGLDDTEEVSQRQESWV